MNWYDFTGVPLSVIIEEISASNKFDMEIYKIFDLATQICYINGFWKSEIPSLQNSSRKTLD